MVRTSLAAVLQRLSLASARGGGQDLDDTRLLERFCAHNEEAAFTLLVVRHGPMVLGVCRRLLGDGPDAEDAFQATFIVLMRRAARLRRRAALGAWLHGIAWRIAARARSRRMALCPLGETALSGQGPPEEAADREQAALLDEEIQRLPERYRAPVVLCLLRGLSCEEAARELGWPKSTVAHRLTRGREALRWRLRGLTVAAVLAAARPATGRAAVPVTLTLSAVRQAMGVAARGAKSASVLALADGVTRPLASLRWLAAGVALAAVGLLGGLAGSDRVNAPPGPLAQERAGPVLLRVPRPRTDADGLPLPPDAIARVGSGRLWHGPTNANLTYSLDGRLLASSGGGHLRLWDARTGKLVRCIACPGESGVQDGQFSADGETVLVLVGRCCRWFSVATGSEFRNCELPVREEWDRRSPVALAPHGEALAMRDGRDIVVYDLSSGRERCRWPTRGEWEDSLTFAAGGRFLSAVERNPEQGTRTVCILGALKGDIAGRIELTEETRSFLFSPDGKLLAGYGRATGTVFVWSVPAGKLLQQFQGSGAFRPLAFTADSAVLAYNGPDTEVVLAEPVSGREIRRLPAYMGRCYAFAPDGKAVAVGHRDGAISQWDCISGRRLSASASPPSYSGILRFSGDGKRLVGWAGDVFDVEWRSGRVVRRFPERGNGWESFVALSGDGARLARPKPSHELGVWDTATGRELFTLPPADPAEWPDRRAVPDFSPDGRTLYGGRQGGSLQAWDIDSGREYCPCATEARNPYLVKLSPCGQMLAAALAAKPQRIIDGSEVAVWELRTGRELCRFHLAAGRARVNALAFSQDGTLVAAAGGEYAVTEEGAVTGPGLVKIVAVRSGREWLLHGALKHWMYAAAFSPDGRALATGDDGGAVRLWEVASGRQRCAFQDGENPVRSLAFSQDGWHLASAGFGPAVVWDVAGREGRPASTTPFTEGEQHRLWQALADPDAEKGFAAMRQLLARPGPAVDFLTTRLRLAEALSDKESDGHQTVAGTGNKDTSAGTGLEQLRMVRALEVLQQLGGSAAGSLATKVGQNPGP